MCVIFEAYIVVQTWSFKDKIRDISGSTIWALISSSIDLSFVFSFNFVSANAEISSNVGSNLF